MVCEWNVLMGRYEVDESYGVHDRALDLCIFCPSAEHLFKYLIKNVIDMWFFLRHVWCICVTSRYLWKSWSCYGWCRGYVSWCFDWGLLFIYVSGRRRFVGLSYNLNLFLIRGGDFCHSSKSLRWRSSASISRTFKGQSVAVSSPPNLRVKQQAADEDYLKEREAADVLTYLSNGSATQEDIDPVYSEDGWPSIGSDSPSNESENRSDWPLSQQNRLTKRSPYEGPGSFPCESCGKIYKWRRTLQNHIKVECGKDPQFQCPYCPLRSKRKGNLTAHIKAVHGAV